jgi:hypothetical protein
MLFHNREENELRKTLKKMVQCNPVIGEASYWILQGIYRLNPSDANKVKKQYRKNVGEDLNLENPRTLSEKIQWLKLYNRDPLQTVVSDKLRVRDYVAEAIGEKYLNELYGVYNSVDEIDLDALPDAFVLKANHGSGWNIMCPDKAEFNWKAEKRKLKRWISTNFYWKHREWAYKNIEPKIICEKFMKQVAGEKLINYKFNCFHGEPVGGTVIFRKDGNLVINTYDNEWQKVPIIKMGFDYEAEFKKPAKYDEMLEVCRKLSKPFPYVRIDLYCPGDEIVFGEITLYSGSGFSKIKPDHYNRQYGDSIDLSQIKAK